MRREAIIVLTALLIAGCGKRDDENAIAANSFVPPVTQAPAPLPGQEHASPLTAYVGHYPRDAVAGVSFFDRTEVANALIEAVPEEKVRRMMIGPDATRTPIFQTGRRIAAYGCEQHNCGDHNWTIYTAIDGNADQAAVCYHQAETMGDVSRWTTRSGTTRKPGACPSA